MSKAQGIQVKVLKYHTFNGTEYNAGDTYQVVGDSHQTAEQYLETLKANRLASDDDSGPLVVNEVGAEPQAEKAAEATPAEAPAADAAKADEPVETPKPKKATHRKVSAATHKK